MEEYYKRILLKYQINYKLKLLILPYYYIYSWIVFIFTIIYCWYEMIHINEHKKVVLICE